MELPLAIGLVVVGLALLAGGGDLLVRGATAIAQLAGLTPAVIGLTVVAMGTSLPELVVSLVAAADGQSDIAVGNVVGSNIFNVLLILGGAALAQPIAGSLTELRLDLGVFLGFSLVAVLLMRGARHISRLEGGLLVGSYAVFLGVIALG